jgi:hypothetical protein
MYFSTQKKTMTDREQDILLYIEYTLGKHAALVTLLVTPAYHSRSHHRNMRFYPPVIGHQAFNIGLYNCFMLTTL